MATGLDNLKIYKMAEELEIEIYRVTNKYPKDEKFRTVDQLRRSSSAVTNNIAEAYNKNSIKEQIHILNDIAKCEAEETKRNLIRCAKKGFCKEESLYLAEKYTELLKAISGYIKFLRKKRNGSL